MNKRVKRKWLKALRSGEYAQGKEYLATKGKSHDKFCCLGVLTDLYLREVDNGWEPYENYPVFKALGSASYLPDEVILWAELGSCDPDINFKNVNTSISNANDSGVKFKTLAKIIEEQL